MKYTGKLDQICPDCNEFDCQCGEGDFKDAQVGDRVYSLRHGWGEVVKKDHDKSRPIRVRFEVGSAISYYTTGQVHDFHKTPDLYWGEPTIEAPPRPKRKVKKTVELWQNRYSQRDCAEFIYTSKEAADRGAMDDRIACVKLTGEYETEE